MWGELVTGRGIVAHSKCRDTWIRGRKYKDSRVLVDNWYEEREGCRVSISVYGLVSSTNS